MRKIKGVLLGILFVNGVSAQTTELQASSKVIVDDGYDHAEMSVTPWGGSHGLFFGAKVNYTGSNHLWGSGNAVYAQPSGQYSYGAFSMGYIANGGRFGFYDGGLSTGVGNPISWAPVMTFARGGNVGIGTDNPEYKFVMDGGISNFRSSSLGIPGQGSIGNGTSLFITNYDPKYGLIGGVLGNGDGWLQVQRVDGNAAVYNLSLQPNGGNIGIGTTDTKGYKLAVNGDAIFTKVKVKQYGSWADYVFEPTYKLPSLQQVEQFIQQHKHLPEVPSAKEVEEKGLDVGENQAVLLKKIEELTLYIIEQNKKIEKLEAQTQSQEGLSEKLELLEQEIKALKSK